MPDGSAWPRISIVTPSYNQAVFIEETVRAVLLQGYPDVEYVIAEDCSRDNTLAVLEPYKPWITIDLTATNGGMSRAINRGFQRCSGEIITWISSDDVYLPGAFATVASAYATDPTVGAIVGAFRFIDASSIQQSETLWARVPESAEPVDLTLAEPSSWRLHQVGTFYLRHALDAVGRSTRDDIRHNPDRELLYRISQRFRIATVDSLLAAFRIHDNSKSWSRTNMLAMADEFAQVFLRFQDGGPSALKKRANIAAYHRAKGYTKYARHEPRRLAAARALVAAATFSARYAASKTYLVSWARVLGIESALRRLRPRTAPGTAQ
jgi:glycosyltransferase involved in cell wall biosynthesis